MSPGRERYALVVSASAARSLSSRMPEAVAAAVAELITADLLVAPRRIGKALGGELTGRWSARRGSYRVLYTIDDAAMTVTVTAVEHRRDAYRSR